MSMKESHLKQVIRTFLESYALEHLYALLILKFAICLFLHYLCGNHAIVTINLHLQDFYLVIFVPCLVILEDWFQVEFQKCMPVNASLVAYHEILIALLKNWVLLALSQSHPYNRQYISYYLMHSQSFTDSITPGFP